MDVHPGTTGLLVMTMSTLPQEQVLSAGKPQQNGSIECYEKKVRPRPAMVSTV